MEMVVYKSKNRLQTAAEVLFLLLTGGVLYYGIEVFWRGWSDWSTAV